MVLQILENLFENSVYWLKIEGRREWDFMPRIEVGWDPAAGEILFAIMAPEWRWGVRKRYSSRL